jgi:hypothetical protein
MYQRLISPGPRLPVIKEWLLDDVWSLKRYESLPRIEYLKTGEDRVNKVEEVIASAASRLYDEFLQTPDENRDILQFLTSEKPRAAVIFDGLSLREMPVLKKLSEVSGFKIKDYGLSWTVIPTETMDFITQRLKLINTAPSQLKSQLKGLSIFAYYFSDTGERHQLERQGNLLLWSAFPDVTYGDSGAKFPQHFEQIHTPGEREILLTSDHGYVFFGSGYAFPRSNESIKPLNAFLGGERFRKLQPGEASPFHPDLRVFERESYRVAVVKGRVQTHPPGPSSAKLYKHGGLSIMEILVPWIILSPEG